MANTYLCGRYGMEQKLNKKMKKFNKIFCIGFHKTGTSSLRDAFKILGLKAAHWGPHQKYGLLNSLQQRKHNKEFDDFDVFMDVPIPSFYEYLDQKFPNSLFILSIRDNDGWSKSVEKHIGRRMRDAKFLAPEERLQYNHYQGRLPLSKCINKYNKHVTKVKDYFEGRTDLLTFDVRQGWVPLCDFIGKRVPSKQFPHSNKAKKR